jgi:hypothetical protein
MTCAKKARNKWVTAALALFIVIFASPSTTLLPTTQSQSPLDSPIPTLPTLPSPPTLLPTPLSTEAQIALNFVAEKYGIPIGQLIIVNEHRREYAELGRVFRAFSLIDAAGTRFFKLMVDLNDHTIVEDSAAIEQAEADAAQQKYGKLEPALYNRLQTLQDNDVVTVTIMVAGDPHTSVSELEVAAIATIGAKYPEAKAAIDRGGIPMDVDDPALAATIERDYTQSMEAERAQRLAPFIEVRQALSQALEAQGVAVLSSDGMALTAQLTKRDISAIEQRADVGAIYLYLAEGRITSLAETGSASEGSSTSQGDFTYGWTMLAFAIVFTVGVVALLRVRFVRKRG